MKITAFFLFLIIFSIDAKLDETLKELSSHLHNEGKTLLSILLILFKIIYYNCQF
jgi:hypothetical protein